MIGAIGSTYSARKEGIDQGCQKRWKDYFKGLLKVNARSVLVERETKSMEDEIVEEEISKEMMEAKVW